MHAKTKQTRHAILARIAGTCLAASLVAFSGLAAAQSVEKGKDGYVKHGCWQCHGFEGQGGITGPALAPNPKPLAFISAFIRNTNGAMPPYQKAVLSDEDLADIHAYLETKPKAPDYKSIPLLNP